MKIIGLTGGIGSGKTAAAGCFAEQGIPVVDADRIGHELIASDADIQQALRDIFGNDIFEGDTVSREKIGERVFTDLTARQRLNALLHPAIINAVADRCAELARDNHPAVIVEAALLGESGRRDPWLGGLILVLAPEAVRIERLAQGRNISEIEARRRIAAQANPETKIDIADWIIDNSSDMDALRKQTSAIVEAIHGLPG